MASSSLIASAKLAARITTNSFDTQISDLLDTALLDLGVAGVTVDTSSSVDLLIRQAQITYFLMKFGEPDNYDQLKASYDEQKAQLGTCTGYTDWGGVDG